MARSSSCFRDESRCRRGLRSDPGFQRSWRRRHCRRSVRAWRRSPLALAPDPRRSLRRRRTPRRCCSRRPWRKLRSRHVAVATAAFAQSPNRQPADKNPPAAQTQPNNAAGSSATQQNFSEPPQGGQAANPPASGTGQSAGSTTAPANPTITSQAPASGASPSEAQTTPMISRTSVPRGQISGPIALLLRRAFGALRPVVSSRHENFGGEVCVRRRQFDREQPGGGLARSNATIYG